MHIPNNKRINNLDIIKNDDKFMLDFKFNEVIVEYINFIRNKIGRRKRVFPLYFICNEKEYELSFNYVDNSFRKIFHMMVNEIYNKEIWKGAFYYHSSTSLNRDKEINDLFNRICNIKHESGKIVFLLAKEETSREMEEVFQLAKPIMNKVKSIKTHITEIKEDFSNYMERNPNNIDYSLFDKFIEILDKYKDTLYLDKYLRVTLNMSKGCSYWTKDSKYTLKEFIELWAKRETDIIGIVPDIENWNLDKFYYTNVLSFSFIYSNNHYAIKKHLDRIESEGITNYYNSKQSGDYVGD